MDVVKRYAVLVGVVCGITVVHANAIAQEFTGTGEGTETDPYIITTAQHLDEVRNFLEDSEVYFELGADIDLSFDTGDPEGDFWNDGDGWEPIGNFENSFKGSFDGNGYDITGLFIDRPSTDHIGLFGYLGSDGTLQNVTLQAVDVTGSTDTGVLTGRSDGTIEQVNVKGRVHMQDGGFIGGVAGRISGTAQISRARAEVEITVDGGFEPDAGGIVGRVLDGSITKSYSSGTISGSSQAGGIAGHNNGTISNTYSLTDIIGIFSEGGLVGTHANEGSIVQSYSAGIVSGYAENSGGFIGQSSGSVDNGFWDIDASGLNSSDAGTGLTTTEMVQQSSFTDWDFSETWSITENLGFPYLQDVEPQLAAGALKPEDEASGIHPKAEFTFIPSASPVDSYELRLAEDGEFTTGVQTFSELEALTHTLEDWLDIETEYHWKVRANENSDQSAWSDTLRFTTLDENSLPAQVNLIDPGNGANDVPLKPVFEWQTASGTDTYRFRLSEEPFDQTEEVLAEHTIANTGLDTDTTDIELVFGETYYWQVRGEEEGSPGIWSDEFSFTLFSPFTGGDGTEGDPWQIDSPEGLDAIRHALNDHFELVSDIDLAGDDPEGPFWNEGNGWEPIGDFDVLEFQPYGLTGSLDGQGHRITGLMINRNEDPFSIGGLFTTINPEGSVDNLVIDEPVIHGGDVTGTLVGVNLGTLSSIEVNNGTMTANQITTAEEVSVGGITGIMMIGESWQPVLTDGSVHNMTIESTVSDGSALMTAGGVVGTVGSPDVEVTTEFPESNHAVIKRSYFYGKISGNNLTTGGLVGYGSRVNLEKSFAEAEVDASSAFGGALVGYLEIGSVRNSYAGGRVTAEEKSGGLIGSITNPVTLESSYTLAQVTGNEAVGGVAGVMSVENGGSVDHVYWNQDVSGQQAAVGSGDDSGMTSLDFPDLVENANYSGFDFMENSGVWAIAEERGTPYLQQVDPTPSTRPLLPEDEASGIHPQTELTWVPSASPVDHYELRIAADSEFSSIEQDVSDIGSIEFTLDNWLDFDTEHHWQVQVVEDGQSGEWSESSQFSTMDEESLPDQVVLDEPSDNSTDVILQPEFSWDETSGTDEYRFQLSDVPFDQTEEPLAEHTTANTGLDTDTTDIELVFGETYHWRVRGEGENGHGFWSEEYAFITMDPFAGGDGTEGDPWQIDSPEGLDALRYVLEDSDVHFLLTSDIDLGGDNPEGPFWNGGEGWEPIGGFFDGETETFVVFEGQIDGNGHTITGLYTNRPQQERVGLFGSISSNGTVSNLILEDVNVTGKSRVGGLAGISGSLEDIHVTGSVSAMSGIVGGIVGSLDISAHHCSFSGNVDGGNFQDVGGLAGRILSNALLYSSTASATVTDQGIRSGGLVGHNLGTISNSYATGDVISDGDHTGGLVGFNGSDVPGNNAVIEASYATGNVTSAGNNTGGLAGRFRHAERISDSFATGDVEGNERTGSLIGKMSNSSILLENSYATGRVSGESQTGGLLGRLESAPGLEISDTFWNTETTGQTDGIGDGSSSGVTGLSTTEMVQQSSFTNWDFSETWAITENLGFPYLQDVEPQLAAGGFKPEDEATGIHPKAEFAFIPSASPVDSYELRLAEDGEFTTGVQTFSELEALTHTLEDWLDIETEYHWKVRANEDSDQGSWSDTLRFTTIDEASLPAQVNLIDPGNGANDVPLKPVFEWQTANGADTYHFQLSEEPFDQAEEVLAEHTTANTGLDTDTTDIELTFGKTYYWQVRGEENNTPGLWSDEFSFTVFSPFAGGDGTEGDPWQINSPEGLDAMRYFLNAHYVLTGDVDLSSATGEDSGDFWNDGDGWQPIGDSGDHFTGTFDGGGYKIESLFIDRESESDVGLFGVTAGAVIEHFKLYEPYLIGENRVGAVAGRMDGGDLSDVAVTDGWVWAKEGLDGGGVIGLLEGDGQISHSTSEDQIVRGSGDRIGGLVGRIEEGAITFSSSFGMVDGGEDIGGLVGVIGENGRVENSFTAGYVIFQPDDVKSSGTHFGGIAGSNLGIIENTYSVAIVDGDGYAGGIAGSNEGTISTTYSAAPVLGETTGGVAGIVNGEGEFQNVYWSNEAASQNEPVGNGSQTGITSLSLPEMVQEQEYAGFDFSSGWSISEGLGLPYLQDVVPVPAIVPLSPINGATEIHPQTEFTFIPTPHPVDSYRLVVGNESQTIEVDDIIDLSYTLEEWLDFNTQYEWEVHSVHDGQVGSFTEDFEFTTMEAASLPEPITLLTPPAGGTDVAIDTDFEWQADGNEQTDEYRIQVSEEPFGETEEFLAEQTTTLTNLNQFSLGVSLEPGETYHWRVRGEGSNGTGPWSDEADFTVELLYADGEGTPEDPWQIATPDQLDNIRHFPDSAFVLIDDIDLSTATGSSSGEFWNDGDGWEPIESFNGILDGGEYTITGLHINRSTPAVGLLGYTVAGNADVRNLNLTGADVTGSNQTGILAGVFSGLIDGVHVSGEVETTSEFSGDAGGIVGQLYSEGSIRNSSARNITVNVEEWHAGGLVGHAQTDTEIFNSYSSGTVESEFNALVGGLVGKSDGTDILESSSSAQMQGSYGYGGGLVGQIDAGQITDSRATGSVTMVYDQAVQMYAGGLAGMSGNVDIKRSYSSARVLGEHMNVSGLVGRVSGETNIEDTYVTGTVEGDNSVSGFIQVSSGGDVTIVNSYAAGKVKADGQEAAGFVIVDGGSVSVTSAYWSPETTGQSDGASGQSVSGIESLQPAEMTQAQNFDGFDFAQGSGVWAIAEGLGTPYLQQVDPTPSTRPLLPEDEASGIHPQTEFTWVPSASPVDHYDLRIAADSEFSSIEQEIDDIESIEHTLDNWLDFDTEHHWQVQVVEDGQSGEWSESSQFTSMDEESLPDQVVLDEPSDNSTDVILQPELSWDETSGTDEYRFQLSDVPFDQTEEPLAEHTTANTGLDTDTTDIELVFGETYHWRVRGEGENGHGFWSEEYAFTTMDPFAGGDGTEGDPWQIDSPEGLDAIRYFMDGHFVLTDDIDLSEATGQSNGDFWNNGDGWEPIGEQLNEFNGSFDGNGHDINGLFIDREDENSIGLFYEIGSDAVLTDLWLTGFDITGNSVVGVVTGNSRGVVSHITLESGTVNGSSVVGGYSGMISYNEVSHITVSKDVGIQGDEEVGGLTGHNADMIRYSHVAGEVHGQGSEVGGLAGNNHLNINNSGFSGIVTNNGGSFTGGITGQNHEQAQISHSYSTGSVESSGDYTGGLAGQNYDGEILYSYATGDVVSTGNHVGGFVGAYVVDMMEATIENSYASGDVSGDENVGGFAGLVEWFMDIGTLSSVYSTGSVEGDTQTGGFAGKTDLAGEEISNGYWNTETSGMEYGVGEGNVTGLSGLATDQMRKQGSFSGFDFNDVWKNTELVTFPFLQDNPQEPPPGELPEPDASPALTAPQNEATEQPVTLTFQWEDVADASTYRIQLSTVAGDFEEPVLDREVEEGTETVVEDLDHLTTYYWRVRGENAAGAGDWSDEQSFTTIIETPETVDLIAPGNESADESLTPVLDWEDAERAESYEIRLADNSNFENPVVEETGITETEFELKSELEHKTDYYWQVRGVNAGGKSSWSEVFTFTTVPEAPEQVVLTEPENEAEEVELRPELSWQSAERAEAYELVIADNADFTDPVYTREDIGEPTYELSEDLRRDEAYYWQVRAVNAGGEGSWSESFSFTTLPDVPMQVELTDPEDGATEAALQPVLSWQEADGVETYELVVADNADFTDPVVEESALSATSYEIEQELSPDTEYHWQVRGNNAAGSGPWSEVFTFTTVPEAPEPVVLTEPENEAEEVKLRPELSWQSADRAETYELVIADNADFTDPVYTREDIEEPTYELSEDLSRDEAYYWQVRAVNAGGEGSWSESFSFTTLPETPEPVVLTEPEDGTTEAALKPGLSWQEADGAETYELVVADNADFTDPVVEETGLSATSYEIEQELSPDTEYHWQVRGNNAAGSGPWSEVFTFKTIPEAPEQVVLTEPENEAEEVELRPELSWQSADRAETYELVIADNADFTDPVYTRKDIEETTYELSEDLSRDQAYYWQVRAVNAGGEGSWSESFSFTTLPDVPMQVELTDPEDGVTETALLPELSWQEADGAETYELVVADNADFANPVVEESDLSATSYEVEQELSPDTEYHWQVRGNNAAGSGAWSEVFTFTTVPEAPEPVVLTEPENEAEEVKLRPELSWQSADRAETYELVIADNADFTDPVYTRDDIDEPTYELSEDLSRDQAYYWQVRAVNAGGEGSWSESFSFTTLPDVPIQVELTDPEDGATEAALQPGLSWQEADGAETYELVVADNADFTDPVVEESELSATSYEVEQELSPDTEYHWQVRGVNVGGTGPWSEVFTFTTVPEAPEPVVLTEPADGVEDVELLPELSWEAADNAESYELEVSADSTFAESVYNRDDLTETEHAVSDSLDYQTKYLWRVRGVNSGGKGAWSDPFTLITKPEAPGRVVLTSPEDDAADIDTVVVFSWESTDRAESYELRLAEDQSFENVQVDSAGISDTELQIEGLDRDKQYHWKVRAVNAGGSGPWSDAFAFTTIIHLPDQVVLVSPENDGVATPDSVSFVWEQTGPEVEHYNWELALDEGFDDIIADSTVSDTVLTVTENESDIAELIEEGQYWWRVQAENRAGSGSYSDVRFFEIVTTSAGEMADIPDEFNLRQNYPNPFNPTTQIGFDLPEPASVRLEVYDVLGRLVSVVVSEQKDAGRYEVTFDASNLSSGTYIYRIVAGDFVETRQMMLVK